MRVITGTARGRKLKTPDSYDVRPTTDNVKESIFNIIQGDVEGRRVLDLFAGTGQLGIEALSRGAASCDFIDSSEASLKIVRENLKTCGFSGNILKSDALAFLSHCGKYDLVFIDPPYGSGLYEGVLEAVNTFDILNTGGIIIVESARDTALPEMKPPYVKLKDYRYGKVSITKITKE